MSSMKDFRQQNAERRLRHASWGNDKAEVTAWGWIVLGVSALVLTAFVIQPLIKLWLD